MTVMHEYLLFLERDPCFLSIWAHLVGNELHLGVILCHGKKSLCSSRLSASAVQYIFSAPHALPSFFSKRNKTLAIRYLILLLMILLLLCLFSLFWLFLLPCPTKECEQYASTEVLGLLEPIPGLLPSATDTRQMERKQRG